MVWHGAARFVSSTSSPPRPIASRSPTEGCPVDPLEREVLAVGAGERLVAVGRDASECLDRIEQDCLHLAAVGRLRCRVPVAVETQPPDRGSGNGQFRHATPRNVDPIDAAGSAGGGAVHGGEGYPNPVDASSSARASTASSMGAVRRPVNVFCWLGWNVARSA